MSMFDRYTLTEYVEALRVFLDISKRTFLKDHGFIESDAPRGPRSGRLTKYKDEPVKAVEDLVNQKSARCEAQDTSVGERYRIARDYLGLNDAQVARELSVSRELVRRWGSDIHRPSNMPALANLLNVPLAWLEEGGEHNLPANSHLGVRVGDEGKMWREQLYGLTQALVAEIPDNADEQYAQAFIEVNVYNKFVLAQAARRAGGRWQLVSNTLLFAPWVPIPEHGLTKRLWSDEVEAIIQDELATKPSVYGAWAGLEQRCKALGLTEDQYPKRISLHKRVEKERDRAEKFGVDLNDVVAQAVAKHTAKQ